MQGTPISRRTFLKLSGLAALASSTGAVSLFGEADAAAAASPTGFTWLVGQTGTTLDRTITKKAPDLATNYISLESGAGEGYTVRTDLGPATFDVGYAITAFAQMTDLHVVDDQSPARVEFLDRLTDGSHDYASAYRPHEFMSTHVVDAMTRALRKMRTAPRTGLPLALTIVTGDAVDNCQYNETRWYIDLLDGGHQIIAESGQPGREQEGVSGNFNGHDLHYWSPEGEANRYRSTYNFPTVAGLLAAARRPYMSTGLAMPWYAAMGNHDGEIQGNYPVHPSFAQGLLGSLEDISGLATAGQKAYTARITSGEVTFPDHGGTAQLNLFIQNLQFISVTADHQREILDHHAFAAEHWNTTGTPPGHGFQATPVVVAGTDPPITENFYDTFYARASENAPILYVTLDTVCYAGQANGRIDAAQLAWLERQLVLNSSAFYTNNGVLVRQSGVTDKLIVLFAHHTIKDISATDRGLNIIDPGAPDFYFAADLEKMLLRFPNVILYVCGHTHQNEIHLHRRGPTTELGNRIPGTGGFWEVATASHIDWPVQSRLFELASGRDQISIVTTVVDLAAPIDFQGDLSSPASLASLARELAANDPTERPGNSNTAANPDGQTGRRGFSSDRNVQLLVPAPFPLVSPDVWGSSVTAARNSAGNLEVFGTKSDDTMWWLHGTSPSSWADWARFPVDGTLHAVAAETNKDGQVEVFGADTASFGQVWHAAQMSGGAWTNWQSLGEVNARSIAAARWGDGHMEVFITTPGGDVWHTWQQSPGGAWGPWSHGFASPAPFPLLGPDYGRPARFVQVAAVADENGSVQVFAVDDQALLWQRSPTATGWADWTMVGTTGARLIKIAAALYDDGRLALFGVDTDWQVWRVHQNINRNLGWEGWSVFDDGRTRMTQVAARKDGTGKIRLFGVDNAGQLWHRQQTASNADVWTGWVPFSTAGALRPDVPDATNSAGTRQRIIMPVLTGLPPDFAQSLIRASGLNVGAVTQEVSLTTAGLVSRQSVPAGSVASEGDTVDIAVSLGGVRVPSLYLNTLSAATAKLISAGLKPAQDPDTFTLLPEEVQKVRRQSKSANSVVAPNTTVHFSLGKFDNR